jgi:hypothetical protein
MFVKVDNFGIESKSKRGFEKGDMHVIITIESTTIVSSILTFQPKLVPMFFHMDLFREFQNFIQSWKSTTIAIIIIGVRGIGHSKTKNQLLIIDGEGEFDQIVLTLGNHFKT